MTQLLLEAVGLRKTYHTGTALIPGRRRTLQAVKHVDVSLKPAETVAVVGESGAGKSTVGRLILRLIEPDGGQVAFRGVDVLRLGRQQLRDMRKHMQMIFQNPFSSLDPRLVVEDAVSESLNLHFDLSRRERHERALETLARVGITETQADRYPYEFSGGQLQRIAIARALAVEPDFIVCDEPVAALDVSVRAQVINLLLDLQQDRGVAYIFISHDLSLVRLIADRVLVMYAGEVVEDGLADQVFESPSHPYTQALLEVIPRPDPRVRIPVAASVAAVTPWQGGCSYSHRCPAAVEQCRIESPALRLTAAGTKARCHLVEGPSPASAVSPPVARDVA